MSASTVSVVVIFHNEEHFLAEAIDSVLAQRFTDWELLLCDDGSTDASLTIARAAACDDDRIRVLQHVGGANRGMSATRNLGIRAARGRYVALLDGDDIWEPAKLDEQVALLDAYPEAAMLCGAPLRWRSWTGASDDRGADEILAVGAPRDRVTEPPELLRMLYPLGPGYAPCTTDMLLRRQTVIEIGGFEERFRGFYEDQAFLVKLYLHAAVYVCGRTWSRYREHPGSCTAAVRTSGTAYHSVRRQFLSWFRSYLAAQQVNDPQVWRALDTAEDAYQWTARTRRAVAHAARRAVPVSLRRRVRSTLDTAPNRR